MPGGAIDATASADGRRHPTGDAVLVALVVLVSVLAAIPYAVAGPGWFREDFASLANVRFGEAMDAAGPVVGYNRPITALVYAFVFGVLGDHPAAVHVLIVALVTLVALLLHALLIPAFGRGPATIVSVVYLLSPSQSSMVHWASTTNVLLSLVLLLVAVLVVQRRRWWLVSGALVGIAVLSYEAVLPAALATWAWYGWRDRRWQGPTLAAATTAPSVAWILMTTTNADRLLLRVGDGLGSLVGFGLTPYDPLWRVLMLAILISVAVMGGPAITGRLHDDRRPELLLAVGATTIVVGYLPFLAFGFGMDFTGEGDRANFLAVIGAAMVITAVGWRIARQSPSVVVPVAASLVLVAVVVPTRLRNDQDWAAVWDETRLTLERGAIDVRAGQQTVTLDACPVVRHGVQGIDTEYSATLALRWTTGNETVLARCAGEG